MLDTTLNFKFCFYKTKRAHALFVLSFYILCFKGQVLKNEINNFSFEQNYSCPSLPSQLYLAKYWYRIDYLSTPDYFNICTTNTYVTIPNNYFGAQFPKSGNSMVGFGLYAKSSQSRENIAVELIDHLKKNKNYCITFYVSLAEKSRIALSNLGVYFQKDSIKTFPPILTNPPYPILFATPDLENSTTNLINDTINWVKIQGIYLANGTEKHFGVGNFRTDLQTNTLVTKTLTGVSTDDISYYYLDDISVVEINPAKAAIKDTILVCANSTFTLGTDSTWDATYHWQPTTGLSCTNCPNPIITVTNNIKYVLTKQQCSATTKDSVVIKIYNSPVTILPLTNATICVGNTTTLSADSNSFFNYTWQPITGLSCTNCALPTANTTVPITYTLTKSACGFSATATVTVSIKPNFTLTPQITITNTITCLYDTLKFKLVNTPNGNDVNYNWQPQSLFVSTLTNTANAVIQNNNYYFVTINNSNDGIYCPFNRKDSIYINIADTCIKPLIIPTVFTPNNDNVNDEWHFKIPYGIKLNSVFVYNRWGVLIYTIEESFLKSEQSKIKTVHWDGHTTSGELCMDGVYFYIVSFELNGENKTLKGNVTLIR